MRSIANASDTLLQQTFRDHRKLFDMLANMAREDSEMQSFSVKEVKVYDPERGLKLANPDFLPPKRRDQYTRILQEVSLPIVLAKDVYKVSNSSVLLTVNKYSEENGGTSKGYINSLQPLAACDAEDIESCLLPKHQRSGTATYKKLEGTWNIFLFVE